MAIKVNVQNNNGSIRLAWRLDGQRFSLNPGLKYDEQGIRLASGIAATMELDLKSGNFDKTLDRYRKLANPSSGMGEKLREELNKITISSHQLLYPFFEKFIKETKPKPKVTYVHYNPVLTWLKTKDVTLGDISDKFESENSWSFATFRDKLNYLNLFFSWCIEHGYVTKNPLSKFKIPVPNEAKTNRTPFKPEEVEQILEAIKTNRFNPSSSAYKHSHYYHFVRFLFTYGCRPAEVIGLQWKHVNLENKTILISEALARGIKGQTSANARVRKPTKTGNKRLLPMNDYWFDFFSQNAVNHEPNDLIFPSPSGLAIDDKNFLNRVWKPILVKLGIEYRTPYSIRHTFGTFAVNQGIPINEVADLMGHSNVKTTLGNYVHKQQAKNLPSII